MLVKNTMFSVCFRGISRLRSACIILRWFQLAHICRQACTVHDGVKPGIDQQIFNRKSISRTITHPQFWNLQAWRNCPETCACALMLLCSSLCFVEWPLEEMHICYRYVAIHILNFFSSCLWISAILQLYIVVNRIFSRSPWMSLQ